MKWMKAWAKEHLGWGLLIFALACPLIGWLWSWKISFFLVVGSIVVIALEASYEYVQG
jgi:hypothetical protein